MAANNQSDQDIFPGLLTPEQRKELVAKHAAILGNSGSGAHKTIEILTYGGGAMGALYSWIISLGSLYPVNFTMICRSNYSVVHSTGFTFESLLFGQGSFRPHNVIKDTSELISPSDPTKSLTEYDFILVCTKSSGKVDIPSYLVTPGKTAIVLFQNGINIEAPYKAAFPENPVISAVLYVSCGQPEPGRIVHVGHIDIVKLGLFPSPKDVGTVDEQLQLQQPHHHHEHDDQSLQLITTLLQAGGCNASATPYIQSDRWLKTIWNGCWNVVCALSGLDTHTLLSSSPSSREMIRTISRELVSVARRALGVIREDGILASETEVAKEVIDLWLNEDATAERNINMAERAVPIVPSMLQDARKGAEMEVEAFCGEVVRTAERFNVEIPAIKALYPILLAMNYRFMCEREGKVEAKGKVEALSNDNSNNNTGGS